MAKKPIFPSKCFAVKLPSSDNRTRPLLTAKITTNVQKEVNASIANDATIETSIMGDLLPPKVLFKELTPDAEECGTVREMQFPDPGEYPEEG